MFRSWQSLSFVLAGSICIAVAGCQEAPDTTTGPNSPAFARGGDKQAPTKPGNFRSTGNTSWSVTFAWTASTDNSGSVSYRIRDNWGREITVPGNQTSVTWKYPAHPPLQAGANYSFSMYAVDGAGNKSGSSGNVSVSLPNDNIAPSVPAFSVTSVGTRHISLNWTSTDDSPYMSYQVYKDGIKVHTGWTSATSKTFTLLQPGTTYTFTAQARDYFENVAGGNTSALSPGFSVTTSVDDGSDLTAPTQPSSVWAESFGDLEMQVMWGASTDNVTPQNVIIYEIYVNGVLENTAIGTTQSNAYGVPGENTVTVIAIDEAGNRSPAGATTVIIPG